MAEEINNSESKRIAVVTGANKGIGLEICRQLASKGIVVVLTARDENRGKEALDHFKGSGLSDFVVFHQLDVVDQTSVDSLADFVKTKFGKLDILVNNAAIRGITVDADALKASGIIDGELPTSKWKEHTIHDYEVADALKASGIIDGELPTSKWKEHTIHDYEVAVQCMQTNYYGAKRMVEAFIPLLRLSNFPRIVNVSALIGNLKYVSNKWAKGILSDAENLSEERVDEVVNKFLKDYEEHALQANGWHDFVPAYVISKAAMNAYTRIMAKKYPTFCINCCCPGYVKTDLNYNTGIFSVEQGAAIPVKLAVMLDGDLSGLFFDKNGVGSFD